MPDILLYGSAEGAEIAYLTMQEMDLNLVRVVAGETGRGKFLGFPLTELTRSACHDTKPVQRAEFSDRFWFFLHLAEVEKFRVPEDFFGDLSAQRRTAQAPVDPLESRGRAGADLVGQNDPVNRVAGSPRCQKALIRMG